MRYGYWMPVFGGWLRNVDDENMAPTWEYNKRLAQRSEQIGFDLSLVAELNLNDIKGEEAPSLDAWSTAVLHASSDGASSPLMSLRLSSATSDRSKPICSERRASRLLYSHVGAMFSSSTFRSQPPNTGIQ